MEIDKNEIGNPQLDRLEKRFNEGFIVVSQSLPKKPADPIEDTEDVEEEEMEEVEL